jgi:hypothetical protein
MIRNQLATLNSLEECIMELSCDARAFRQTFVKAGAGGICDLPKSYSMQHTDRQES